jgi:hypothetical protein
MNQVLRGFAGKDLLADGLVHVSTKLHWLIRGFFAAAGGEPQRHETNRDQRNFHGVLPEGVVVLVH